MSISLDAAAEVFRQAMRETVKRYSLWYLVQGALLVVAGIFAIMYPVVSSVAVIVTLGATALAAVLGRKLSITEARTSQLVREPSGTPIVATYHPSAVLRVPDYDARVALRAALLADLRRAASLAAPGGGQ